MVWGGVIYHSNKIDIENKLEPSLRVAIDKDLNTRFVRSGVPYSTPNTGKKINKGLITTDEKGERIYSYSKTNIPRYTSFTDESMKQSYLNIFSPICPDTLNHYFHNELLLKDINATTGIRVTDLKKNQTKITPNTPNSNYCHKYSYLLGIEDEIRIDVFIQYTFISVLFHGGIIWVPFLFLLCSLIICIHFILKYLKVKKEYEIVQLDEQTYRLGESIFNIKESILYKDDKPYKIRKQESKLLVAFLQAPNYFLSIDDINTIIWGDSKISTSKRIHTLISDLRKDIAPDLEIPKDSNNGYRLGLH